MADKLSASLSGCYCASVVVLACALSVCGQQSSSQQGAAPGYAVPEAYRPRVAPSSAGYGQSSQAAPAGYVPYNAAAGAPGVSGTQGMLNIPSAPARPKVVGTGTIKYSYKSDKADSAGTLTEEGTDGRVYVIQTGDCLWNLSNSFLSDPWRWREIWEKNQYIANPDLIYPGNQLVLGTGAAPAAAAPPALDTTYRATPRTFNQSTAGFLDDTSSNQDSIELARKQAEELELIRSIIKRKILTSEFLAACPFLWFKADARGLIYPGDARIEVRKGRESYQQFENVKIKVFAKGANYRVGDTVDIFRSDRMVTYNKRRANLVRRIANARVIEVKGSMLTAVLYRVSDVVSSGDRVAHAEKFPQFTVTDYVAPTAAFSAGVFERVELTLFPYPYHSFIIDRGAEAGVRVGDLFFAYQVKNPPSPGPTQLACAVHVGDDYTTCAIVKLFSNTLGPGDRVDLVRRIQTQ